MTTTVPLGSTDDDNDKEKPMYFDQPGKVNTTADAALVIAPAHAGSVFDLRIREVVCKPRDFYPW